MILTSVCRLCMSEKELRWVFEEDINSGSDVKTIIFITTGVEILQNDSISQKICTNCFKLTGKMFEFRERAIKTNKYLKDQCKGVIQVSEIPDNNQPSVISIKPEDNSDIVYSNKNENDVPNVSNALITHAIKPVAVTPEKSKSDETTSTDTSFEFSKKSKKRVHASIEKIFVMYTEIKVPSSCLGLDLDPSVSLEMDYVENYFRLNKQDMKKYVQQSLISNRASIETWPEHNKTIKDNKSIIEDDERRIVEENKPGTIKDPGLLKVSPIRNKLSNILISQQCTDNDDTVDDIVKNFKPSKRRRISDSSTETEPMKQPTLMETLRLKPKENVTVHRCTVCNYPMLNDKALKHHYQTHFKCTYCKKRFKILERKQKHDKSCAIKHCLTRKVDVKLKKIDISKYLDNLSEETAINTLVPIKLFENKKTEESRVQANIPKNLETYNDEIIELSDDDSDPPTPAPPTPVLPTPVFSTPVRSTPAFPTPVFSTPVLLTPASPTTVRPTPAPPTAAPPTAASPTPAPSTPAPPTPAVSACTLKSTDLPVTFQSSEDEGDSKRLKKKKTKKSNRTEENNLNISSEDWKKPTFGLKIMIKPSTTKLEDLGSTWLVENDVQVKPSTTIVSEKEMKVFKKRKNAILKIVRD